MIKKSDQSYCMKRHLYFREKRGFEVLYSLNILVEISKHYQRVA